MKDAFGNADRGARWVVRQVVRVTGAARLLLSRDSPGGPDGLRPALLAVPHPG